MWRKNIVMRVIIMALEKKGIFNVNFVNEMSAHKKDTSFTWKG
jgi:hypothetical protein